MKLLKLTNLAVSAVDAIWSLADDFAPSTSLRETRLLIQEVRESYLDGTSKEQETMLLARISALKQTKSILATRTTTLGGSPVALAEITGMTSMVEKRLSLLMSLLHPIPDGRDVLAGTFDRSDEPHPGPFRRLSEHPTTRQYVGQRIRRFAESTLGTRSTQNAAVERRARVAERLRVLAELDEGFANKASFTAESAPGSVSVHQAAMSVIAQHIDAARFANAALRSKPAEPPSGAPAAALPAAPAGPPAPSQRASASGPAMPRLASLASSLRKRIPIDV